MLFVSAPSTTYKDPSTYDNRNLNHIQLDGDRYLPVVKEFRYLGTLLSRNCKDDSDVISRINKAGNAFGALRKCIFGNRSVNSVAKKSVYEGLILSILLYGSESWCITEKLFNMLRVFHNRCVRTMCNVTMKEVFEKRITTNELLERLGLISIESYVYRRQLRWAGHISRMSFDRLPRKMLSCWVKNRRPVGAPEFTYGRGLYKALRNSNIDIDTWFEIAFDRQMWKSVVEEI